MPSELIQKNIRHSNRPLRIAFIGQKGLPAQWGGIEHHVDEMATRLAARGHQVTAYVRKWYTKSTEKSYKDVRLITRPTIYTKHLDAAVHTIISSIDAMVRPYDVVHYHGIGPALFCMLPRLTGKKIVTTVHRLDYNGEKWGGFARAALYWGERSAFTCAHSTMVVSRDLEEYYLRRGVKAIYLPSGVNVPAHLTDLGILREKYGLKGNDYLLNIGRWNHDKRVRELVEAFLLLKRPGVKLVVAGDTNKSTDYRESVIAAARSSPDIIFPGYVKGQLKAELLSNALGFVTASEHEGLPIALLEAMAYSRPCLASDIPPHREPLVTNNSGVLFPAGRSGELEKAIERFLALSQSEREAMGSNAQKRVIEAYDWDRVVDKLESIYYQIVADTGSR